MGLATVLSAYTATAAGSVTSGSASAAGFVSDGATEVEFGLTRTVSGGAVQANYKLSVPEKSISVVFDGSISILTQAVQMTATVKAGGNTDVIAVNGSVGGPVSGTITHNGTVVINISGTQDDPTFTDASGTAVTATEAQQLRRVALFITAVLNHVNALLAPAHVLLLGF